MAGESLGGPEFSSFPRELVGGIVAHNEEAHLRSSVRSLTQQQLPDGVDWREFWVVASGCTDRTVEVARSLADEDPRVHLVVERERRGKARALREIIERARGDALVLLNSDARAEPGAVRELLRTAAGKAPPFAVMGRPVVPAPVAGRWAPTFRWMWQLHHEFHLDLLADGTGRHLSDELLLVSLPGLSPIPDGVINDGSYLAVWLAQHAGGRWYASDACVSIDVPETVRDHLHQRRRIHVGNAQVGSLLRTPPATLPRQFLEHPADTARLLRRMLAEKGGFAHFARLATWEVVAHALAVWDRLPPRRDHVRWQRIRSPSGASGPDAPSPSEPTLPWPGEFGLEERVRAVVGVASRFGTGVELEDLVRLLPENAPTTAPEVREWIGSRPDLGELDAGAVLAPHSAVREEASRLERGRQYLDAARKMLSGPLRPTRSWSHCVCVTGSTAYGRPSRGDDLDLFVVTRSGGLWWVLAYTYLALRISQLRGTTPKEPMPCFNFVVDHEEAVREFSRNRGFLFAREALTAQPIAGEEYYRGLLANGEWMGREIPRLYAEKLARPFFRSSPASAAPLAVRVASLLLFPWLAAYLQLAGVRRNHAFRREGNDGHRFRTETQWRRLSFTSRKFEDIREAFGTPSPVPGRRAPYSGPAATASGPRGS